MASFQAGQRRPGPRGSELMPNLLMELDSSGIKSTSEIATPPQSASALKELNQKRNLLAAGRVGRAARTQARTQAARPGRKRWDPPFLLCSPNLFHTPSHKQRDPSTKPNPKGLWQRLSALNLHKPQVGSCKNHPPKSHQSPSTVPTAAHPKAAPAQPCSCLLLATCGAKGASCCTGSPRRDCCVRSGALMGFNTALGLKRQLWLQTLFCSDLCREFASPFFLLNGKKKKSFQVRGKKSIYSWVK